MYYNQEIRERYFLHISFLILVDIFFTTLFLLVFGKSMDIMGGFELKIISRNIYVFNSYNINIYKRIDIFI